MYMIPVNPKKSMVCLHNVLSFAFIYICIFVIKLLMKKKLQLEPIGITKTEASYQALTLQMMSSLVEHQKQTTMLLREILPTTNIFRSSQTSFKPQQQYEHQEKISSVVNHYQSSSKNINHTNQKPQNQNVSENKSINRLTDTLQKIQTRLVFSEQIQQKLVDQMTILSQQKFDTPDLASMMKPLMENDNLNMLQKALSSKKNYTILSQILPYSDRREMKVKISFRQILEANTSKQDIQTKIKSCTVEWLGDVYRATASICWNMLLNNLLSFDETKILFTENIIFNFIEFMHQLANKNLKNLRHYLAELVNDKSEEILQFLCRQYPQTKIQAPNIALRVILPLIDNKNRIKYDLLSKSTVRFSQKQSKDYTSEIMKFINELIDRTNNEEDNFRDKMTKIFQKLYEPEELRNQPTDIQSKQETADYRRLVSGYTKYVIGRKISRNTPKYSQQEIQDGVFFVKSPGILRIVVKWVQELMQVLKDPDTHIENSHHEFKTINGETCYLYSPTKKGIYQTIIARRGSLFKHLEKIRRECYLMEALLSDTEYTYDSTQLHLSRQQISVGKFSGYLHMAIASYICCELNELIHFLIQVPLGVDETQIGIKQEYFQNQARKELDQLSLITCHIFDLLRCKCSSNQKEILWLIKHLIYLNTDFKDTFEIVRVKDRLAQGTRDILINARLNKGLVCEIQLSVTSTSETKQDLLDKYNHFLYQLKRSKLGPLSENVSIWTTLEQRSSYFINLIRSQHRKQKPFQHCCRQSLAKIYTPPLICSACGNFYPIPATCLLSIKCEQCGLFFCGQCFYSTLDDLDRKKYLLKGLMSDKELNSLKQYTQYDKALPSYGIFLKKDFLKKQLSYFIIILKDKKQGVTHQDNAQVIMVQTVVREKRILNRQILRQDIPITLINNQFYPKPSAYQHLKKLILFEFIAQTKKSFISLKELQQLNQKEPNLKLVSIVREPSYIGSSILFRKNNEKKKQLISLKAIIGDQKITVVQTHNLLLLCQVFIKGSQLRRSITIKNNVSALKSYAYKEANIVSMQFVNMTNEMELIQTKMKPQLYQQMIGTLKKLYLNYGQIKSIVSLNKLVNLQVLYLSICNCISGHNQIQSLQGVQSLRNLVVIRFDDNRITSMQPLSGLLELKHVFGNENQLPNMNGIQKLSKIRKLTLFKNKISIFEHLENKQNLELVFLKQNYIKQLPNLSYLSHLKELSIGGNNITEFHNLNCLAKTLRILSIDEMNLKRIPQQLKYLKLQELWISKNSIEVIQNLDDQDQLRILAIRDNKIIKMQNLDHLCKLEQLFLDNNQITQIQSIMSIIQVLKVLSLKNNPLQNCEQILTVDFNFNFFYSRQTMGSKALAQIDEFIQPRAILSQMDD